MHLFLSGRRQSRQNSVQIDSLPRANEYLSVDDSVNLRETAACFSALPGNGLSGRDHIGSTANNNFVLVMKG